MRLLLTSNDPRSRFLFDEIEKLVDVVDCVNFDDLDLITRVSAAALSWLPDRTAWRRAYYMHPLVQRRRAQVLAQKLSIQHGKADALLMWSSWFRPTDDCLPFFQYFDESYAPKHGLPFSPWRQHSFRMQAEGYCAASGLFCMSEWARDQIVSWHGGCAAKLQMVGWGPCGVDLSAEEIPESARKPIVLHVSNDPERKGLDYLIDTAKRVRANLPQAEFHVIGDLHKFDISKADGHVLFIGQVADKAQLAQHFRHASVFFLPHRYDRSPHVAVEAMSAGLPIVGSRQGGLTQLIKDQGTGFLVDPGDVSGYALALEALLRNPEQRASMGAAARDLMRHTYTWSQVAAKMVDGITTAMRDTRGKAS